MPRPSAQARTLGTRLRKLREDAGHRVEIPAAAVDRSADAIRTYENGAVIPPVPVLTGLAEFYGVTVGDLLGEEVKA